MQDKQENPYVYPIPEKVPHSYIMNERLLDLVQIATAPSLGRSTALLKKIDRRLAYEKNYEEKQLQMLENFKMNSFDEPLFRASQMNKGILDQKTMTDYAHQQIENPEKQESFLQYTKFRLGYLARLGLLNDITRSNRIYCEKITIHTGDGLKEMTVSIRENYQYQINVSFYKYLREYRKEKELRLKEQFQFGKFDAYIYSLLKNNNGQMDYKNIKRDKVRQAIAEAQKIQHQIKLMLEMGYLEEKASGMMKLSKNFEGKLDTDRVYLNQTERKIVDFIKRHKGFSYEQYKLERIAEAEQYTEILKNRIDKLITLKLIGQEKNQYVFTANGEEQLKDFYARDYVFTSFDRSILNYERNGIARLDEIFRDLEERYGLEEAFKTIQNQKHRLFVMMCAGLVTLETENVYLLTEQGKTLLEKENTEYLEQKRQNLLQTFQYTEQDEKLLEYIRSKGGKVNPKPEIREIMDALRAGNNLKDIQTYNAVMRNYTMLGNAEMDVQDGAKLQVRLGYIEQSEDENLSLTAKGKRLVNHINCMDSDRRRKVYGNKKVKLLNDIDKSGNCLNPEIYLKNQRLIKDKDLWQMVKLLRYRVEELYMAGLLEKIEHGSYSIHESYMKYSEIYIKQQQEQNMQFFKFSNVHKFMFRFCRNEEFSLTSYKEYISKKLSGQQLEREMRWKQSSCCKLVSVGYFEKIDENTYRLTTKGIEKFKEIRQEEANKKREQQVKDFAPGKNYINLLKAAKENVLDEKDIFNRIQQLPKPKQQRELDIKSGMLRKMINAQYLEPLEAVVYLNSEKDNGQSKEEKIEIDTGMYRLTQKAILFIQEDQKQSKEVFQNSITNDSKVIEPMFPGEEPKRQVTKGIKITQYDIKHIVQPAKEGILLKSMLEQSDKKLSVEKRIKTLLDAGMLVETADGWQLTGELLERVDVRKNINLEHEKSHSKRHSFYCLTTEQKKTIEDIKEFINLTGSQIIQYIYGGNQKLYNSDMRYLLEKHILEKDKITDTYVLSKVGVKLAAELTGDGEYFKSKLYSRREELKHDILIYSAFKDVEKELIEKGKIVTSVKTDRKLRSEDMKNTGQMRKEYPDLYIEYEDPKTKEKGNLNIEIDLGYSEKVIGQKASHIPNLRWYTTREKQKEKILRKAKNADVRIIDEDYWKR